MWIIKNKKGYTIVETLIALAVTSVMFITTVVLISGQLSRYQFKDSTKSAQQSVQDALNDVQSGYFNALTDPSGSTSGDCNTGLSGVEADSNCVYVGKKIEINSTTDTMIVTPLWLRDTDATPIGKPANYMNELTANITTTVLPGGVDYTKDAEVYVLFTNYTMDESNGFVGGSQSVRTFLANGPIASATTIADQDQIVCMENGDKRAKLIIGVGGSTSVDLSYNIVATDNCP